MVEDEKFKLAALAGASHALKYMEQNPRADYRDALKFVAEEKMNEILKEIEEN